MDQWKHLKMLVKRGYLLDLGVVLFRTMGLPMMYQYPRFNEETLIKDCSGSE